MNHSDFWIKFAKEYKDSTADLLKICEPGSDEWAFCTNCLRAYEIWFLNKKSEERKKE